MMPKEALTDRAIRDEVIPGLPLSTICELLSRFRPDDLAQEPLAPGESPDLYLEKGSLAQPFKSVHVQVQNCVKMHTVQAQISLCLVQCSSFTELLLTCVGNHNIISMLMTVLYSSTE